MPTLNAWGIHFCSLLLTFGMVNWLPTIMNKMGYDLGSALLFSVTLNAWRGNRPADRCRELPTLATSRLVVAGMFLLGALLDLDVDPGRPRPSGLRSGRRWLEPERSERKFLANVLVGNLYPVEIRGTGLRLFAWASVASGE